MDAGIGWCPPASWTTRRDGEWRTPREILDWIGETHLQSAAAFDDPVWFALQVFHPATSLREITVHAYNADTIPTMPWQDLELRDLRGVPLMEDRHRRTTGFDTEVLCELLQWPDTARVLADAAVDIVARGLPAYAFRCQGGTHRSVGCAVLLVLLAFPRAVLCPHTNNTIAAADAAGWTLCDLPNSGSDSASD